MISVIIPCYNAEDTILETLTSVYDQENVEFDKRSDPYFIRTRK